MVVRFKVVGGDWERDWRGEGYEMIEF